ncbi:MAG: hypothetical protein WBD99_07290 [Thermodesulfobacteriota bacterium]
MGHLYEKKEGEKKAQVNDEDRNKDKLRNNGGRTKIAYKCQFACLAPSFLFLDAIAQLACIDGALIISTQFNVVAFGSKLSAPKWSGSVLIGPDGFGGGGGIFDVSKLGTRHNSAINFVGSCTDSIIFVISQDGPIRGFAYQDSNTIFCWPDCSVSMFA